MKNMITLALLLSSIGIYCQNLADYLRIAEENNPGLQAQHKEFEAALQKVPQVSTLPDPTLSASAFGQMVETRVGPQEARFSLSQMFPWFGTLKAQGNAAALMAEAKYQAFIDARNKLYYDVYNAYLPLYELKEWIAIEEENFRLLESYKSISNSKFKYGSGTLVDVLRVDIMQKEAQTNLEILRKKEAPLRTQFNKLLNRDALDPIVIVDSLVLRPMPLEMTKDSLEADHPLLNSVELMAKASEASERAAIKQGLPMMGVGLDYVIVGERNDIPSGSPATPPDNGQDAIMPMVTISLPIFRGKYRAAVKEAKLMQERYSLERMEIANSLLSNYEMTSFEIQQQEDLIKLFDEQIKESEQALNLLFTAYGNSGKEFEEVLRMQQQLLQYDKLKISALTQYHLALAKLDYITAKNQ